MQECEKVFGRDRIAIYQPLIHSDDSADPPLLYKVIKNYGKFTGDNILDAFAPSCNDECQVAFVSDSISDIVMVHYFGCFTV